MDNYPNNSHAYKEQQKKAADRPRPGKVISGTAETKKKSEMSKLADALVPGAGDVGGIKNYIIMDVLIPSIKNAICDIVVDSVNMLFRGERTRRKEGRRLNGDYVSYSSISSRRDDHDRNESRRAGYSPDDVTVDSRADAVMVLEQMDDLLDTYGRVTVADLYDLVGVSGNYTDNKYGWTNLHNAEPIRLSSGKYLLKLPKVRPLD